jgi:hypothetical protein
MMPEWVRRDKPQPPLVERGGPPTGKGWTKGQPERKVEAMVKRTLLLLLVAVSIPIGFLAWTFVIHPKLANVPEGPYVARNDQLLGSNPRLSTLLGLQHMARVQPATGNRLYRRRSLLPLLV